MANLNMYEDIKNGYLPKAITFHYWKYPNLFFWIGSLFFFIGGISRGVTLLISIIPLIILIFSVYGIGSRLHSRKAGALAVFIITTFPHVFSMSRYYTFDFNMMAFLALSIYTLLTTNHFDKTGNSILFGICLGLTTLTRPSFCIFFIGPFIIYSYHSFFLKKKNTVNYNKRIVNLLFSIILTTLIALTWWNLSILVNRIHDASQYVPFFKVQPLGQWEPLHFNWGRILYYFNTLFGFQILYYYSLLFIAGLIYFLLKKENYFLLSGFLIPYFFFTFYIFHHTDIRFMLPYLIFIALIISVFLVGIKHKRIRFFLIILTLLLGLFQYLVLSYFPDSYPNFQKINSFFKFDQDTDWEFKNFQNSTNPWWDIYTPWYIGILSSTRNKWDYNALIEIIQHSLNSTKGEYLIYLHGEAVRPLQYIIRFDRYKNLNINLIYIPYNVPISAGSIINGDFVIVDNTYSYNTTEINDAGYILIDNPKFPIPVEIYAKRKNSSAPLN